MPWLDYDLVVGANKNYIIYIDKEKSWLPAVTERTQDRGVAIQEDNKFGTYTQWIAEFFKYVDGF